MITRGDVCVADIPGVGRHRVVVVTRDTAVPVLTSVVCVWVTTRVRGHVAEVEVGSDEGLREECVANCDNLFTLPQAVLRHVGRLGPTKLHELDRALVVALGLRLRPSP
ncbi:MAG: type II toxin-antitoxin system PemK/MazF family toxin [Egibacteraceae bacterium]